MRSLTYIANFNFNNGFDDKPDTIIRDIEAKTLTVKDGATGQARVFKTDDAKQMQDFFSRVALIGTSQVYPAKFAPCPHHGGAEDKTLVFALPIHEYNRLAEHALENNGDFNTDKIPDVAYISPQNAHIGYVHIEPRPDVLRFGQIRKN